MGNIIRLNNRFGDFLRKLSAVNCAPRPLLKRRQGKSMMRGACAIVGQAVTDEGIGFGIESRELRAPAVDMALADANWTRKF